MKYKLRFWRRRDPKIMRERLLFFLKFSGPYMHQGLASGLLKGHAVPSWLRSKSLSTSAHWRTSAPSIYGKYGKAKACPKGFAISGFRARALMGLGSVEIRGTHVGYDGALTGVEFACSNIRDAKKSKRHRMPSDPLSFTLQVQRRLEFHITIIISIMQALRAQIHIWHSWKEIPFKFPIRANMECRRSITSHDITFTFTGIRQRLRAVLI